MSQGARNWPFLTLTGLPGARGGDQEIGLAAEEGRDLQDVDRFGDGRALLGLMHVGRDGKAELSLISAKMGSAASSPSPRALAALVRFALSKELL